MQLEKETSLKLKCSCKLYDIVVKNRNNKEIFFDIYFSGTISAEDIKYIYSHIVYMQHQYPQQTYRYVRDNFKKDIDTLLTTIIPDVKYIISRKQYNKPKVKKMDNTFNDNAHEIFNDRKNRDINKTLEIPSVLFPTKSTTFLHRIKRDYDFYSNMFTIYTKQKSHNIDMDTTLTSGLSLAHYFNEFHKDNNNKQYIDIFHDTFNMIKKTTDYLYNIHKKDKKYYVLNAVEFNYRGHDFLFINDLQYHLHINEHIL